MGKTLKINTADFCASALPTDKAITLNDLANYEVIGAVSSGAGFYNKIETNCVVAVPAIKSINPYPVPWNTSSHGTAATAARQFSEQFRPIWVKGAKSVAIRTDVVYMQSKAFNLGLCLLNSSMTALFNQEIKPFGYYSYYFDLTQYTDPVYLMVKISGNATTPASGESKESLGLEISVTF